MLAPSLPSSIAWHLPQEKEEDEKKEERRQNKE
jgi:hypothetical protein